VTALKLALDDRGDGIGLDWIVEEAE